MSQQSAEAYTGKVEETSDVGVSMPELFVFKGADFETAHQLPYRPTIRDGGHFLRPVSAHKAGIRVLVAKQQFLEKLQQSLFPQQLISFIDDHTRFTSIPLSTCSARLQHESSNSSTVWLVLPSHPVWHFRRSLHRGLHSFVQQPEYRRILDENFGKDAVTVRLSWKLCRLPHGSTRVVWQS